MLMEESNIPSDDDKLIGYAIDDDGFIIDTVLVGGYFYYLYENVITVPYNSKYYRNRWNGQEWIEGATQEEIDELKKVEPTTPTQEERIDMLENMILLMMEGQ